MMKSNDSNLSALRIFHALPTSDSLDIFIDQQRYAQDLWYEDFTPYKYLFPGEHELKITRHRSEETLYTRTFWLTAQKIYTLVLAYPVDTYSPQAYLINDPPKPIPDEHLLIRAVNYSQHTFPLTLQLIDTKPYFKKIPLRQNSSYLSFLPTTVAIELSEVDGVKPLVTLSNNTFKIARYYTLYIIGGIDDYPLKWVQTIDGNSFIHFEASKERR